MGRGLRSLASGLCLALCCSLACPPPSPRLARAEGLFGSFGIKEELELGRKFDVLVRSRMPLIEDPEVRFYVQSLVERLEAGMPPQPVPFHANVLLHGTMNAFAVPGGYVFVQTGLIMQLEHEAELAGVIAHELAHVTQRHIAARVERGRNVALASLVGALAAALLGGGSGTGAMLAGTVAAGQAAMLNYSRMDETEADEMGLQYLVRGGFNPQGMAGAFEKIRRKQWSSGTAVPEYLSTHPDVGGRINEVLARIRGLPANVRSRKDDDARFRRVRTLIWARYGDPNVAERHFQNADDKDALAWMGRGILAERQQKVSEARAAFDRAVSLAPEDPLVWREAGHFQYSTGDLRAEASLGRALSLAPDDLMAQYYAARLFASTGRHDLAQGYFERLLNELPQDAELHALYGRSLGESGRPFAGFLHLAYSALYRNEKRRVKHWLEQARSHVQTPEEQAELDAFKAVHKARSVYWK